MNKSNAHLFLPLVQALAAGKTIEYFVGGGWSTIVAPSFSEAPERYRIKAVKVVKWGIVVTWGDSKIPRTLNTLYNTKDEADTSAAAYKEEYPVSSFSVGEISWEE